jgi:nucleotide-binding universal stress UspA family protein
MIQLKNILVPTDFSENATKAFPYAKDLAESFGGGIIVAHITEPDLYFGYPATVPIGLEGMWAEIKDVVEQRFEEVRAAFGDDLDIRTVHRDGPAAQELIELATEEDVSLIVIATHGHTGLKHLFLGSTAERVVRGAPCPVLTCR